MLLLTCSLQRRRTGSVSSLSSDSSSDSGENDALAAIGELRALSRSGSSVLARVNDNPEQLFYKTTIVIVAPKSLISQWIVALRMDAGRRSCVCVSRRGCPICV